MEEREDDQSRRKRWEKEGGGSRRIKPTIKEPRADGKEQDKELDLINQKDRWGESLEEGGHMGACLFTYSSDMAA